MVTLPDVGSSRPSMRPIAVDLPAPFGPSRATVSPVRIVRSTRSSAVT
jgi:hypothetical protein